MRSMQARFWAAFAIFATCALGFGWHSNLFTTDGAWIPGKLLVWAAFLGFLSYTIYCSSREDLFASIQKISQLHWGRQVGADL